MLLIGSRLSISSNNYDCVFKCKVKGRGMEVSSRCDVLDVELGSLREVFAEKRAVHTGDFQ